LETEERNRKDKVQGSPGNPDKKLKEDVPIVDTKDDVKDMNVEEVQEARNASEAMELIVLVVGMYTTPNIGNGLDLDIYSWGQSLKEVNFNIPIPHGTKSRFIICDINKNHLTVGLKGQPPIIDGEFYRPVKVEDCFWSLASSVHLSSLITGLNGVDTLTLGAVLLLSSYCKRDKSSDA
ncbi:hypothetical protein HAX54_049001, partial [Datura stramonium]|nr:hypothetical protein [Datura stramonium]